MSRSFALPPVGLTDALLGNEGSTLEQPITVHTRSLVARQVRQFELLPEPPFECDYVDVFGFVDGCLGNVMPNGETVHGYNCSYWWQPEGLTKTPF